MAATVVAVTPCWNTLLCQAQQSSIPSNEPIFKLLGWQYVEVRSSYTPLCVCLRVYFLQTPSPHQLTPGDCLKHDLVAAIRQPREITVSQCHCVKEAKCHLHPQTPSTWGRLTLSLMHYRRIPAFRTCCISYMKRHQQRTGYRRKCSCSK